jgi:hypothetical protein
MGPGKFLTAAVAGGVAFFFLGFLLWGILLDPFFQSHLGTATGVVKEPMDMISLALGQFFWAVLLTTIIGTWAGVSGFGTGFKIGAVFGFLTSLSVGLTQYSMANLMDLTGTLADPFVMAVWGGLGGGVIGLVLGSGQKEQAV